MRCFRHHQPNVALGGRYEHDLRFSISGGGGERLRDDKRWQYGVPPVGKANFAWMSTA